MRNFLQGLPLLILSILIISCTTVTPPQAVSTTTTTTSTSTVVTSKTTPDAKPITPEQQTTNLANLKRWGISGKIAVQTAQNSGSASVNWVQNNASYSINISGPMGSQNLQLSGRPGAVVMNSEGKQYFARTPEELLARRWGFRVPVSNIFYWVRGLPAPGSNAAKQYDAGHRLTQLRQNGWLVQYLSYQREGSVYLPNKIYMTSATLKTKLMIYSWRIG